MARFNLIANLPPEPTPLSWGDNTIVSTSITSRFDDPQIEFFYLGMYRFSKLDFTTDTFPKFKPRPGYGLNSIQITGITLPPSVKLQLGLVDVNVGDVIDMNSASELLLLNNYPSSTDMTYGKITYINSEDGYSFPIQASSTVSIIILPATDAFQLRFAVDGVLQYPKDRVSTIEFKDIIDTFQYYSDPNTSLWQPNTAVFNFLNQYILDIKNETPFKLEVYADPDSRLSFLGEPLVLGQKIPLTMIQMGYLKVDFSKNNNYLELIFRFGDSYIGSFRLNPI